MRRTVILAARAALVLLLAAAIFDMPLPTRSEARVRLHLVDRSGSLRVPGPVESLTLRDVDAIVASDLQNPPAGDTLLQAAFEENLEAALEAALARNPTEIVLYTDGRDDPGRAPLLCAAAGVPVHVFALGPLSVHDARLVRIRAPGFVSRGETASIEATVEATFTGNAVIRLGDETRELSLTAGVPKLVSFTVRPPCTFRIRIGAEGDACPENNEVTGRIEARAEGRRILALSRSQLRFGDAEVRTATRLESPHWFDAVVLDNVDLTPSEGKLLAGYVADGGALLLMGGPHSHAAGGWGDTELEALSPLRARPDRTVAVVLGIDASGSMQAPGKLDAVVEAVREAWSLFGDRDAVVAMRFTQHQEFITDPARLRDIRAGGATHIADAIDEARRWLELREAGRKHILLFTDGETPEEETPEQRKAAADRLGEIGLTVVTTEKEVDVGERIRLDNWGALAARMHGILSRVQGTIREHPGKLEPRSHTVAFPETPIPFMNLTALKPGAELAAAVGRFPAAAFGRHGAGRVGAFAFEYLPTLETSYAHALEFVTDSGCGGLTLTIDPLWVRAKGTSDAAVLQAAFSIPSTDYHGTLDLARIGSDRWEGTLPEAPPPGTLFVTLGRTRAAATIPCAPEFCELGVDREALERLARQTGGHVLGSVAELDSLPRPKRSGQGGGRTVFLIAALFLLFAEMAMSTFWKP